MVPVVRLFALDYLYCVIKPKRNEWLLKKSLAKLKQETDIVEFIQEFRAVKAGLKELLGPKAMTRLLEPARLIIVDTDDEQTETEGKEINDSTKKPAK